MEICKQHEELNNQMQKQLNYLVMQINLKIINLKIK